jgi:hypothetical protein
MASKPTKSTKPKPKPAPTRARRTTRTRSAATEQRRFLAADIAAATLVGYREGRAATLAESITATLSASPLALELAAPSAPIKIIADGTHCAAGDPRTDHVAVLLPDIGLMIHPVSLGNGNQPWSSCDALCRDLRVLGHADWQLASREHWNHILDLTRHSPAVDTSLYPGIKPGWHWTSTPCAWSSKDAAGVSAAAWYVDTHGGSVFSSHRDDYGFALAVRRVGQ